jgi:hypothetical protein
LPKGVDVDKITSEVRLNGMLVISAPALPGNHFDTLISFTFLTQHKRFVNVSFSCLFYSVFQGFSKAKSANGGSILSSSQFLILPQLPQKIKLASKVVKVDSKIIILLPKI